ncbi:MAG: hypothetical protein RML46_06585 [Anaerolineae bacterium]|nr:hypothetical protein [Anaerolineae bacterium]
MIPALVASASGAFNDMLASLNITGIEGWRFDGVVVVAVAIRNNMGQVPSGGMVQIRSGFTVLRSVALSSIGSVTHGTYVVAHLAAAAVGDREPDADNIRVLFILNSTALFTVVATLWQDARQSAPIFRSVISNMGSSDAPSVTLPSAHVDAAIDALAVQGTVTATAGPGQTVIATPITSAVVEGLIVRGGASYGAGASSVVLSWSLSASRPWAIMGASMMPASPLRRSAGMEGRGAITVPIGGLTGYSDRSSSMAGRGRGQADVALVPMARVATPGYGIAQVVVSRSEVSVGAHRPRGGSY